MGPGVGRESSPSAPVEQEEAEDDEQHEEPDHDVERPAEERDGPGHRLAGRVALALPALLGVLGRGAPTLLRVRMRHASAPPCAEFLIPMISDSPRTPTM